MNQALNPKYEILKGQTRDQNIDSRKIDKFHVQYCRVSLMADS
jgi:hypothetical protein